MVPAGAITEATVEEAQQTFDERARSALGMSGSEFLASWSRQEFKDDPRPEVAEVAVLIPLGRAESR